MATDITPEELLLLHTLADAFVILARRVTELEEMLDEWMLETEEPYARA
jgi:hypothetical protein